MADSILNFQFDSQIESPPLEETKPEATAADTGEAPTDTLENRAVKSAIQETSSILKTQEEQSNDQTQLLGVRAELAPALKQATR